MSTNTKTLEQNLQTNEIRLKVLTSLQNAIIFLSKHMGNNPTEEEFKAHAGWVNAYSTVETAGINKDYKIPEDRRDFLTQQVEFAKVSIKFADSETTHN